MASYELAFLQALSLTVLLEIIAAAALKHFAGRRLALEGTSYPRFIIMVALASALTLPYAWFILPAFVSRGLPYILTAEISVTVIEALWYWFCLRPANDPQTSKSTLQKNRAAAFTAAVILSAVSNAFSYLVGNVIF